MLAFTSIKPNVMITARRLTMRAPAAVGLRVTLLVMLLVMLSGARFVLAQESQKNPAHWPPNLTLESIHLNGTFGGNEFRSGEWSREGPIVRYIEQSKSGKGTDLVAYDLEKDERFLLLDGDLLCALDVGRIVDIHGYAFSQDASKVLIFTDSEKVWREATKGYYYLYDLKEDELIPISDRAAGFQLFAKLSPDASRVAFVRDRNLYLVDLKTGNEKALTTDGSQGGIINGTFDWVYEEEFGLRDGWQWSPDGNKIAFFKLDETETRDFAMTDLMSQYPTYVNFRYPKAGEKNSRIKVGVIDIETGATSYFETSTWGEDGKEAEYIARMGWTPEIDGSSRVWMMRLNRDQNELDLLFGSEDGAQVQTILQESESTWIEINDQKLSFLEDGKHFVWQSEGSGNRHLYLYKNDGKQLVPITSGDWDVSSFHGIDEASSAAYFTAAISSPMERDLYSIRVDLGGGDTGARVSSPIKISSGAGVHGINMSPDFRFYIDQYSNSTTPPDWTLRASDGHKVQTLEANAKLKKILSVHHLPQAEFIQVPGSDGSSLNALMIRPSDFDPDETYPLLMYVYGGPGSQTVIDKWGGNVYLWHAFLADELGIVIASVDNRGTGARGKAFKSSIYLNLGQLEAADQISAAQHLGKLPYIDSKRIGIWGWSYGGYMTLMSMLSGEGPETFKLGVAVAPVSDWRLYDTIYTERYMSTPQNNPLGYKKGAPTHYAHRLGKKQKLLIMHGDFDDNVHFQNTVQMINALQVANKQFDLMMYPGKNHSISGGHIRLNLFTKATDYIKANL